MKVHIETIRVLKMAHWLCFYQSAAYYRSFLS